MFHLLYETPNSTNRKRKAEDLMKAIPPKRLHFRGPNDQQNWLLPDSIIYYITKTPSNAKAWEELIQSCKYFFAKNPIIVADILNFSQGWEVFTNTSAGRLQKRIPPKNVSYKLWITETLRIYGANRKYVSSIISQIYRCDATELHLNGQILSFKEFLFFSRNVEVLRLGFTGTHDNKNYTVVKNEDGTIVPLEQLVKTLTKLKQIKGTNNPTHSFVTKNTARELLKIPHFFQIQKFLFTGLPEVFDVDAIFAYLKKNKHMKFELHFADSISQTFKTRLEKIVDEIIETETHDYKPPLISFDGLAEEKKRKISCLYYSRS
uniref:Uncharacterized protein n=1 Tax=Panagrolaimus davidi TaxID=227884 RepID=A0A914QC17_9BILA